MFGGAYDNAPNHMRPIYGALNFRRKLVGGAHRFGSAHFRLTPGALQRATYCYPDSVFDPTAFAVASKMSLIERAEADFQDDLDDYVEAQVHGPMRLDHDVEALVLDPSLRDTEVGSAARRLPCPVEWHPGFRLGVDRMQRHPDYRGRAIVELGCKIAVGGHLDPHMIGVAARTGRHDEHALKRVWHYVARFGAPESYVSSGPAHLDAVDDRRRRVGASQPTPPPAARQQRRQV